MTYGSTSHAGCRMDCPTCLDDYLEHSSIDDEMPDEEEEEA